MHGRGDHPRDSVFGCKRIGSRKVNIVDQCDGVHIWSRIYAGRACGRREAEMALYVYAERGEHGRLSGLFYIFDSN